MAPIIGQADVEITPTSFEVSDPIMKWQRELDSIRARHDRLEVSNRQDLLAHKDQIAQEVTHRLNESMSAINAEIMEYLLKTQRQIQNWAEDTKSARWEALELRYKEREEERRKHKDQQILDHFKLYETIMQRNADAPQQPSAPKTQLGGSELGYRAPEAPGQLSSSSAGVRVLPSQGHLFTSSEPQRQYQPLAYHPMVPPQQSRASHPSPIHQAASVHQDAPFHNESEASMIRSQNKRKADEATTVRYPDAAIKRPRTRDGPGAGVSNAASSTPFRAGQTRPASQSQTSSNTVDQRRISFAEVYQDGNAEYKHIIVEYPTKSNKWYILRCDEHVVHFGKNPLLGAAKHLHSVQHNNAAKLHSLAVDQLGHLVHDCTAELADKNNAAVNKAFQEGYVPLNVNRLNKAERANQNQTSPDATPPSMSASLPRKGAADLAKLSFSQPPPRPQPIAADPRPGELYLGYWAQTKTRFPVMVLPLHGDLSATGLPGTLASIGLLEAAPRCINVDRPTQQVIGWAPGYENGGPLSSKREYPVMYFDGRKQVGWLQAKYISPFNFESPEASTIPEFDAARDWYARAKGFPDYEHLRRQLGVPPTAASLPNSSPREPLVHTPTSSHFPGLARSPRAAEHRPVENGSDTRRQWHSKNLPGTGSFRIPDRNSPSLVASHQGFTPSNSPPLRTVPTTLGGTSESLTLPPILATAHSQSHGSGIHRLLGSDVSPVTQHSAHPFVNSNPVSFSSEKSDSAPSQPNEVAAAPASGASPRASGDESTPTVAANLMGIAHRAISASASATGPADAADEVQPAGEMAEPTKTLREQAKLSMEKLTTAFHAQDASVAASDSSVSSLTPVPTSASEPPSRKSTPTISPHESNEKWDGRTEEAAAAPSSRPVSSSSAVKTAASPAALSPMPTPVSMNDEFTSSKEKHFVVTGYSADGSPVTDGPNFTLVVGSNGQVAEAQNDGLKVQIDPLKIAGITMPNDEKDSAGKAVLQLQGVDGAASQQLAFESTSDASPAESGQLQARQFIRWIKSVNQNVAVTHSAANTEVKSEA